MNHAMKQPVDKNTGLIVQKNVCLRIESRKPDKKIYRIAGTLVKDGVKKVGLVGINNNERKLIKLSSLYRSYVECLMN